MNFGGKNIKNKETFHKIIFANAQNMIDVKDCSIDLVVTSPMYPMIELWDLSFVQLNPEIETALKKEEGSLAFELMHKELDKIWNEVYRVLKEGGIACINIGNATRRIGESFSLYPSHSRIITHCCKIGFTCLPFIIWRKLTNVPNKFLGSGMFPSNAYVTLEHEYILILRKGRKREFKTLEEKRLREESAFFWEERNVWFSDLWDLQGIKQALEDSKVRDRSAAFPFELAYRLINMFSIKNDVILDPCLGTGTTMLAAMASKRNSIGFEINKNFSGIIKNRISNIVEFANTYNQERVKKHTAFMKEKKRKKKTHSKKEYTNAFYGFPVITSQETKIKINSLVNVKEFKENNFQVNYSD
ncbi:MAG: DNA-methyltransferase [Candidatus Heimdallarchaeaceae archaeon]